MSDAITLPAPEGKGGPVSYSLEVRGGRTGFRRRPILGDRFLIGSDPVCDLRLDGRLAAPLHCLLRRDGDRLEVERLTAEPIAVNGTSVEHAELAEGDTLTVGSVRLIVRAHLIRFDVVRPVEDLSSQTFETSCAVAAARHASERTAAQIADLVEAEEDRIGEFEQRRQAGAAALLDAVKRTRRPAAEATEAPGPADAIAARFEQLVATLQRQAGRRIASESDVREAADELLAAQRELLGQADRLLRLAMLVVEASRGSKQAA